VVQIRDQWKALMNTVMNPRVHKMLGNSSIAAQLAVSQEVVISVELVMNHISIRALTLATVVICKQKHFSRLPLNVFICTERLV
jgi:hypothetical protein